MLNNNNIKKRFGTCSKDCYGSCVFLGLWDDTAEVNKFKKAIPSKNHQLTNGFFCNKFNGREKLLYHPERLKVALERSGPKGTQEFNEIKLKDVINKISNIVSEVIDKNGPESIIAAHYAGNFGLISKLGPLRFFNKLGATITTGGICNEAGSYALEQMFGIPSISNPFQILSAKLILVWGSNLYERNVHAYHLVKKAMKNGAKLVVIDTRKHLLAEESDIFLQPYPGSEFFLAKFLINYIVKAKEHDHRFISKNLANFKEILTLIKSVDAKQVIQKSGVRMDDLEKLGNLIIKHKHETIFNIGFGIQKYYHGGLTIQLISLLQVILGNLGKPGTGLIYDQGNFSDYFMKSIKKYISKEPNLPVNNRIKLIDLGWALNSLKYKLLFVYNFNPASSLPNQNLVRNTLEREDLITVVLDPFLTETTKYADFVIPSKLGLENDDIYNPYYVPGVSINQAGPCPFPNCLTNYEFFQEIAKNLGWSDFFQDSQEEIFNNCINLLPNNIKTDVETQGYHILFRNNEIPLKERFSEPDGNKITLSSKLISENPLIHELNKENEFYLISPSHKNHIHSQFRQLHPGSMDEFNKVFLCTFDIEKRDFQENDMVLVSNRYGKAMYRIGTNDGLRPNVALIYSGSPFFTDNANNVNLFTPQDPEKTHLSGSYNSAVVDISKSSD